MVSFSHGRGGTKFKPVGKKLQKPLVPQFPLAEPALQLSYPTQQGFEFGIASNRVTGL